MKFNQSIILVLVTILTGIYQMHWMLMMKMKATDGILIDKTP